MRGKPDRAPGWVRRQRAARRPGKGCVQRPRDKKAFDEGWDRIFGKGKTR